jgi:NDP-sugar pyrophosphorylase family protein
MSIVPANQRTVLIANDDTITDLDLNLLVERHESSGALATMMLTHYQSQFGVVEVGDDDFVQSFIEKGLLPVWINAGVYLFDRSIEANRGWS